MKLQEKDRVEFEKDVFDNVERVVNDVFFQWQEKLGIDDGSNMFQDQYDEIMERLKNVCGDILDDQYRYVEG